MRARQLEFDFTAEPLPNPWCGCGQRLSPNDLVLGYRQCKACEWASLQQAKDRFGECAACGKILTGPGWTYKLDLSRRVCDRCCTEHATISATHEEMKRLYPIKYPIEEDLT